MLQLAPLVAFPIAFMFIFFSLLHHSHSERLRVFNGPLCFLQITVMDMDHMYLNWE